MIVICHRNLPAIKTEPLEDGKLYMSSNIFGIKGGDELAPIQESSPKSEKFNVFTLPSISAQLGNLMQLPDVGDKDTNSAYRPSISQCPPIPTMFQTGSASHPGIQTSSSILPNDNFRRKLPSPRPSTVTTPSPDYSYNKPSKAFSSIRRTTLPCKYTL
jgi:hypothetical protein